LSFILAALILVTSLAACGGGGSATTTSSSASSTTASAAAPAPDSPIAAAAQAYADAHPLEAQVRNGTWCSDARDFADQKKAYKRIAFVAVGPSSVRINNGLAATCANFKWSIPVDVKANHTAGVAIGHYQIEHVGDGVPSGPGTIFPWSGHLVKTDAFAPLAALWKPASLPTASISDGSLDAHKAADGSWVIEALCARHDGMACGGYALMLFF
jgi:hypothetical protein